MHLRQAVFDLQNLTTTSIPLWPAACTSHDHVDAMIRETGSDAERSSQGCCDIFWTGRHTTSRDIFLESWRRTHIAYVYTEFQKEREETFFKCRAGVEKERRIYIPLLSCDLPKKTCILFSCVWTSSFELSAGCILRRITR
jgi:hypothetical protein